MCQWARTSQGRSGRWARRCQLEAARCQNRTPWFQNGVRCYNRFMTRRVSRRSLLSSAVAAAAMARNSPDARAAEGGLPAGASAGPPVAVSSANGLRAVARAVKRMSEGADPLDAAIEGVNIVEDDPDDMTVGYWRRAQ